MNLWHITLKLSLQLEYQNIVVGLEEVFRVNCSDLCMSRLKFLGILLDKLFPI